MDGQVGVMKTIAYTIRTDRHTHTQKHIQTEKQKLWGPNLRKNISSYNVYPTTAPRSWFKHYTDVDPNVT